MNGRSCSSSAVSDRGMESDSVFHNFLVCMELLLVLPAVLAIPNLNALPVHYAKQVPRFLSFQLFTSCFSFAVFRVSRGSLGVFGVVLESFREPFWCHFGDF